MIVGLILEIVESMIMHDASVSLAFLHRLQIMGVHLSIVHAVISFATALGMAVTGEGIETGGQLEALAALGCRYGQGYYLATDGRRHQ